MAVTRVSSVAWAHLVSGSSMVSPGEPAMVAGIEATNNTISLEGHDLLRISSGQIVEHWTKMDSAELLQQLNAT